MAAFYARYIPPATGSGSVSVSAPVEQNAKTNKRKEAPESSLDVSASAPKKQKKKSKSKSKHTAASEEAAGQRHDTNSLSAPQTEDPVSASPISTKGQHSQLGAGQEDAATETTRLTEDQNQAQGEQGQGSEKRVSKHSKKTEGATDQVNGHEEIAAADENKKSSKTKKRKRKDKDQEEAETAGDRGSPSLEKHASIYAKFEKSKSTAKSLLQEDKLDQVAADKDIELHGLEPLPQPAPVTGPIERPTYATLPPWLSNPFTVPSELRKDFKDLGLEDKMISTLEGGGYSQAFPIQSAVIPMLLRGPNEHAGDVCISAATGSGKTLAYALPLVAGIKPSPISRLRGLIVVPTRELVRQAREACELCASGTGLRVGAAVGTTSIKEEQAQLMRRDQVYDPIAYKAREDQCMTADDWTNFSLQDYISELDSSENTYQNHISTYSPNVDILICTPGRLVDHVRSTKGFTLSDLEWLVIDEADRLLNESFQEWLEIVIPALDAKDRPNGRTEKFLHSLGYPMRKPQLRKVILSATMTRDIDKLNSLRLRNPKFVAVGNQPELVAGDAAEEHAEEGPEQGFSLPSTLQEKLVPVGDGADKPLYLLKLLLSHCGLDLQTSSKNKSSQRRSSVSSSSESESSVSSSDEDSSISSDDSDLTSSSDESDDSTTSTPPPTSAAAPQFRSTALVFAKSSEAASRLSRLLSLIHPNLTNRIGTLTKSNKSSTARKTLSLYRQGKLSVIIATDRASRGLDLPDLSHVISYDVPTSCTTYVHRVGRTARAGREGCAWTLVAHREGRWFANEIVKGGKIAREGKVEKIIVDIKEDASDLKKKYADALEELGREVTENSRGPRRERR